MNSILYLWPPQHLTKPSILTEYESEEWICFTPLSDWAIANPFNHHIAAAFVLQLINSNIKLSCPHGVHHVRKWHFTQGLIYMMFFTVAFSEGKETNFSSSLNFYTKHIPWGCILPYKKTRHKLKSITNLKEEMVPWIWERFQDKCIKNWIC